jgi:hypothetical protein
VLAKHDNESAQVSFKERNTHFKFHLKRLLTSGSHYGLIQILICFDGDGAMWKMAVSDTSIASIFSVTHTT